MSSLVTNRYRWKRDNIKIGKSGLGIVTLNSFFNNRHERSHIHNLNAVVNFKR